MGHSFEFCNGYDLESYFFGFRDVGEVIVKEPERRMSRNESIWWVINREIIEIDDLGNQIGKYDPTNPQWGLARELFLIVKRNLHRRCQGSPSGTLWFYVSTASPLDWYYGIDAFFLWHEDCRVTLDISFINKQVNGVGRQRLKADLVVTPEDMTSEGLVALGGEIAGRLNNSLRWKRFTERKKREKQEKCG